MIQLPIPLEPTSYVIVNPIFCTTPNVCKLRYNNFSTEPDLLTTAMVKERVIQIEAAVIIVAVLASCLSSCYFPPPPWLLADSCS